MKLRIWTSILVTVCVVCWARGVFAQDLIKQLEIELARHEQECREAENSAVGKSGEEAQQASRLAEMARGVVVETEALLARHRAEAAEKSGTAQGSELAELHEKAVAARSVRGREIRPAKIAGDYAVVVSRATYNTDWCNVVRALVLKYNARVVIYERGLRDWVEPLRNIFPRYACFVAQPGEIGPGLPPEIHVKTRSLDDDPHEDVVWAILTGGDVESAFRVAAHDKPLRVKKAMAGFHQGLPWGHFKEYMWWYEGGLPNSKQKLPDGNEVKRETSMNNAHEIVEQLNTYEPDIFFTSGHGRHDRWNIGYGCNRGYFVTHDGVVCGKDKFGQLKALDSPNPKIYFAFGNCEVGRVLHHGSLIPSWIRSGGAYQAAGYVGLCGPHNKGVATYVLANFTDGTYTFAEAFYLTTGFPGGEAAKNEFVLYGDPAWDARMTPTKPLATWEIAQAGSEYTVWVDVPEKGHHGRHLFLPRRLKGFEVVTGEEYLHNKLDNLILVAGKFDQGRHKAVVFRAEEF